MKNLLTRIGARLSVRAVHRLNAVINYLEVGRWMAAQGFDTSRRVLDRRETYQKIAETLGDVPVLYLEFGVHRGESIRIWSELLINRGTRLYGFDSFEGLPEDWTAIDGKGTFSTGGQTPVLADDRVQFVSGWFDTTLPGFVLPPHERLIVHLDADLYSSTKTVLDALGQMVVPGSYVLFDEFADRLHELRAFDEFLRSHPDWRFRLVGVDPILARVAFERVS